MQSSRWRFLIVTPMKTVCIPVGLFSFIDVVISSFFFPVWMEDVEDFFHTCFLSVKRELKDIWLYVQSTGKRLVIIHNSCFSRAFQSNVVRQLTWRLVQPMNCFCLVCCYLPTERCRGHKYFLHSQNYPFRPAVCSTQKTWEFCFHQMSSKDAQREGRRDYLSSAHMALPWTARICHQHQRCSCICISKSSSGLYFWSKSPVHTPCCLTCTGERSWRIWTGFLWTKLN